jgi:hypothetical protein
MQGYHSKIMTKMKVCEVVEECQDGDVTLDLQLSWPHRTNEHHLI